MKTNPPTDPYLTAFRGNFTSLMSWSDLDIFWQTLQSQAHLNWYVYALGETPPTLPSNVDQLNQFITEIDALLRREHDEDYCGIVYTDDKTHPRFIKIYDPNNLGVSCGYSDNPPLPGWIISILPPTELNADVLVPQNRRRWWRRIFG